MIETKLFQVRDDGTHIPVMATRMWTNMKQTCLTSQERSILRRAGFGPLIPLVQLNALQHESEVATWDFQYWDTKQRGRTMRVAHEYIEAHWSELESGQVICVEFILGERVTPKEFE